MEQSCPAVKSSQKQSGDPLGLQNDQSDTASRRESETAVTHVVQREWCKENCQYVSKIWEGVILQVMKSWDDASLLHSKEL